MAADARPVIDPKTLGRLDALPGSLGKVTLCAVFTLGIAAFVSVRKWLATRSAEKNDGAAPATTTSKFGFRSKGKGSDGAASGNANGNATNGNNGGITSSSNGAVNGAGTASAGSGGGEAGPSPLQRPQLPPRNYFTIRASLHVKRHNAKLMEWFDAQLGIQLPYSPQLFELTKEERQAPLILLSFRTVREATHRMAVTVEELYETQTAATYCEASLARIADCARIMGTSTTRIGNKEFPAAEYCYLDETQTMVFVFSLFVVHERLAVTLQYVAPSRVRNVMPTAFYDLARYVTFAPPAPSSSYLLVSEPRLGLGYHLPLDFLVHEGLAESDGVEDRLFTSTGQSSSGVGNTTTNHNSVSGGRGEMGHMRAAAAAAYSSYTTTTAAARGFDALQDDGDWAIPYATAMSRGGRRMGLITSYEPPLSSYVGSGSCGGGLADLAPTSASGFGSGGEGSNSSSHNAVPYVWRPYLEQQVCKAVRQLGLVLGPGPNGNNRSNNSSGVGGVGEENVSPRVIFQAPDPADATTYANAAQTLLMEAYPLSVALGGNFSAGDDGREDDGEAVNVTAFSLFREVRVDVNSSYVTLVPDTLDAANIRPFAYAGDPQQQQASSRDHHRHGQQRYYTNNSSGGAPVTVKAYWSAFYVPVGNACVSFHFIASALRHTSTEFVSFCAAVMNSVSLGNHYGQAVSVLYCNTRHDVMPFRLSLPPTGMSTVEEPMLADPLCVVQATYGAEKVAVSVRVFPLFTSINNTNNSNNNYNAEGLGGRPRSATPPAGAGGKAAAAATTTHTPAPAALDGRSTSPSPSLPLLLRHGERRGTRQRSAMRQLQFMIRYYLTQFPGGVHIVSYAKTTINAMPAIVLCFRPMWCVDGGEEAAGAAVAVGDGAGGVNAGNGNSGAASGGSGGGVLSANAVPSSNNNNNIGNGAINNWEEFGGGSSQGASSWADTREAMLEDEVGQLNPFAQYFAPPPPPASYLWGQPPQPPQPQQMTAAAVKKAGAATPAAPTTAAAGNGDFFYGRNTGDSQRSQEEMDDPLRVAVAVCCEGNAFLFQTSASEYTLGLAQEAVQATAAYLALIPRTS